MLTRQRRVKVAALAPLSETGDADEAGGLAYKTVELFPGNNRLGTISDVTLLRRRPFTGDTIRATRVNVGDRFNAPGDWASRQIVIGFRQPDKGFNAIWKYPPEPPAAALPLFPLEYPDLTFRRSG